MPRQTQDTIKKDQEIANKILEKRICCGFTRQDLAAKIGVTNQQLEKYEKGLNRVSVGRMYVIAKALKTPIDYFFDCDQETYAVDNQFELSIRTVKNFMNIKSKEQRKIINSLIKSLSDQTVYDKCI